LKIGGQTLKNTSPKEKSINIYKIQKKNDFDALSHFSKAIDRVRETYGSSLIHEHTSLPTSERDD
jgi:hypothetical protein